MWRLIAIELRKRRGAMTGWGIGMALFAAMILSVAPALADQLSQFDLSEIAIYQAMGITGAIDSVANLLAMYIPFFGLMLAVYGTITGSNALAGEEDNGTLEMLLSAPIPRWKVVVSKIVAIGLALLVICLFTFAGFVLMMPAARESLAGRISALDFLNASLDMWPLAFFFAMLALFAGAYLPRRGHALGFALTVLIGSYLFNNLIRTVGSADLERLLVWQPFHYYIGGDVIIKRGVDYGATGVLVAAALVCAGLALMAFQRRNITVGAWPWQR
jgi:ABC-2 type transport system permease protein